MRVYRLTAIRVGVLCLIPLTVDGAGTLDGPQTITALASIKTAGGASASAPLTVVVRRFTTDAERDELKAALMEGGTPSARALLAKRSEIGSVQLGARQTAIKFAYARTMGDGRLITVVTAEPLVLLGAGLPGAKPTAGYDLGLVMLQVAESGPGSGELVPATKIRMNDQGAVVTEDYSAEVVHLSNVVGKRTEGTW
jgi:hypothetical protein